MDRKTGTKNVNGKPHIDSIDPAYALPGGEVRIVGTSLRPQELRRPQVRFGDVDGSVIIGSDQIYALKNYLDRPRVFVRVGKVIPCDKSASKEELRDRIVQAWRELFEATKSDYNLLPEELPQSAQERWGRPAPAQEMPAQD